jgi:hypothetical protein
MFTVSNLIVIPGTYDSFWSNPEFLGQICEH